MAEKRFLDAFEEFDIDLSENMIQKCMHLCITYGIDQSEFGEMFFTYCANNLNGADPTESTIDDFERKELMHYKSKAKANTSGMAHQGINDFDYGGIGSDGEDNDVMGAYICTTPKTDKSNRSRIISTPVSTLKSTGPMESPVSIPLSGGTGKVVYTFGTSQLIKSINWVNTTKQSIKFERISEDFSENQNYMYDNLLQKTNIAADRIFDIGEEICAKLMKDRPDVYDKDLLNDVFKKHDSTQTTIKRVGRICSDNDCQLDLHSTLFICADELNLESYQLHFDRMKSFALFPGQTVFVQGVNPRRDIFFVDEIVSERYLTYADPPQVLENLNIIVAAGPFTSQDDLSCEPLNELVAYCKQNKPDVLILLGPFLDADHPLVLDGSMRMSMEQFFENTIFQKVMNNVSSDTEVYVISSSQDVHSTAVYPTAPYASQNNPYKNLKFLPDPCIIKINGVTFGITATDIYNHILDAEVAVNAGDRVKRVVNHLFNQASFYPMNPSSEKVSVDLGLTQQFACLPIVPNILILKSSAKCFAREVINERGCLVLNPGSMYENSARGTFSRLVVTPSTDEKASLNSIIGCQIIKI